MAYKTPGVYIVEKNAFPNSVVEVATAVPAFIGYTEKADNKGSPLANKAWRITSMSEFHNYYGFAPEQKFSISDSAADPNQESDFSLDGTPFYLHQDSTRFQLYYNMLMFFQNGGGPCYIVSVGDYSATSIDPSLLTAGIDVLVKEQEPTMVVVPDAVSIADAADCISVQQAMLAHCAKLRNRFAILDVYGGYKDRQDPTGDCVGEFRDALGINSLDYAAAYYPWLHTTIVQDSDLDYQVISTADVLQRLIELDIGLPLSNPIKSVAIQVDKTGAPVVKLDKDNKLSVVAADNTLIAVSSDGKAQAVAADPKDPKVTLLDNKGAVVIGNGASFTANVKDKTSLQLAGADKAALPVVGGDGEKLADAPTVLKLVGDAGNPLKVMMSNGAVYPVVVTKDGKTAVILNGKTYSDESKTAVDVSKISNLTIAGQSLTLQVAGADAGLLSGTDAVTLTGTVSSASPDMAKKSAAVANITKVWEDDTSIRPSDIPGNKSTLDKTLRAISPVYNNILLAVKKRLNLLAPSAAMAGIYTLVDNSRGVWKAPANVSLNSVIGPTVNISSESQEDLNVTTAGKSINAIRTFIGEGTLVWGGRTLDGNSLDWRYVNVRRTMIMLEESIKLASKAYVFEPNVGNTWVTIKSMIRNFLTGIWKRGGLAGAVPDDAFGVFCGLGETMTPDDILEGILRVTVLVALSRPAEFIEITFQQQMQKS